MICSKCKNLNICKSPLKGDDITECSNYVANVIDWEQRQYEIVKDIVASYVQHYGNETSIRRNYHIDDAISIANEIIKRLKEK